jgi:hypothetical protein
MNMNMDTESSKIEGQYTPPQGTPIPFEIDTSTDPTKNKLIGLSNASTEFENVYPNGYGTLLPITPASFEHFKKNVLNKEDVSQYVAEVSQTVNIPGTWRSCDNMITEPSRITGQYIPPPPGAPIDFKIQTGENATDNKVITLVNYSHDIVNVYQDSKGRDLHITPESFEYFKDNVLNQNVFWNNAVVPRVVSIPGTWQTNTNIAASYDGGSSRKPKRIRLSSRRKSNKRRRSRRNVNRKTKKT